MITTTATTTAHSEFHAAPRQSNGRDENRPLALGPECPAAAGRSEPHTLMDFDWRAGAALTSPRPSAFFDTVRARGFGRPENHWPLSMAAASDDYRPAREPDNRDGAGSRRRPMDIVKHSACTRTVSRAVVNCQAELESSARHLDGGQLCGPARLRAPIKCATIKSGAGGRQLSMGPPREAAAAGPNCARTC